MPDASLEQRIRSRMESIRANQLERTLRPPSGIDLSSNDYLDLSSHPRLKQAMADAVFREGVGSTGSRLLRGDRTVFGDVERRFAAFKGTERALYFSSGYLANLAVLTTLAEKGDVILSDERNHASLVDACRLSRAERVVFRHNDAGTVRESVTSRARAEGAHRFVVTESLFSMDGDVAPLRKYAEVCRDTGATLVVDEAHAVGVYGARGSGLLEDSGIDANACVSINSAGKALGVCGAFVCGPTWAIDYLIQRARPFIFSTAPPPSVAAALSASLDVMAAEPERRTQLATRVARLHDALDAHGLVLSCARSHIVPIVIGDNDRTLAAAAALQAGGFDVRAIRPPSVPPGTARLRISINAGLDDGTIDRFADALARVFREVVLASASSASSAVESFNA